MHTVGITEIYIQPQWNSQEQRGRRRRRGPGAGGGRKELTCNCQQHQWNHYYAALHRAWIDSSSPMRVCVWCGWLFYFFLLYSNSKLLLNFSFFSSISHTLYAVFLFRSFSLISFYFLISFLLFSHSYTHFTVRNFARFTVTILRTMGEKNKMPHCVCV